MVILVIVGSGADMMMMIRYQHRRLSIRTPTGSNNNTPKVTMVTVLYYCNVYIK